MKWAPILSSFLLRLDARTYSRDKVAGLDLDQKVEEILKRLVPSLPATNTWRDLPSPTILLEPDALCVALKLSEESLAQFRKITFQDYIREALYPGETVDCVEGFIDWHDGLFDQVSNRLEKHPEEVGRYARIEQVSTTATILPFY